jgi:hypothetical protein
LTSLERDDVFGVVDVVIVVVVGGAVVVFVVVPPIANPDQ